MARIELTHNPLSTDNIRVLLEKIGTVWVSRIQKYFDIGGPDEAKWAETQKPQKAAILKAISGNDTSITRAQLAKYFDAQKKPLVLTGILRQSFTYNTKIISDTEVALEVGTNVSYAADLQFGNTVSIPITEEMKVAIRRLTGRNAGQLAFLRDFLNENAYVFKIKPRKILLFDKVLKSRLRSIFAEFFEQMNIQNEKKGEGK